MLEISIPCTLQHRHGHRAEEKATPESEWGRFTELHGAAPADSSARGSEAAAVVCGRAPRALGIPPEPPSSMQRETSVDACQLLPKTPPIVTCQNEPRWRRGHDPRNR
jgi:hypothetical protein